MTYEEFLPRLEGVHNSGNRASALCPAHEDKAASLSVSKGGDGKILVKCHAGCTSEEIVKAMGLEMKDLFPEKRESGKWEAVAQYDYTNAAGELLYQKVRYRKPDGGKSFSWRHPTQSGQWEKERGDKQLVLYNLPAVIGAGKVYLVEGEKDVETLKAHGRVAASTPDGAKGEWKPQYTEALKGKAVVILQDNDAPGKAFAQNAAFNLHSVAASVKVLDLTQEWDKLKEHGDISDVLAMHPGQEKEALLNLDALEIVTPYYAPKAEPEKESGIFSCFHPLSDFQEEKAAWLIPGWLPEGQLALLAADGGVGKTSLWCNIVAALSSGAPCILDPEGYQRKPVRALILTTEDSIRKKLKKQLREAGANMNNVIAPDSRDDKEGLIPEMKFGTEKMGDLIRCFKPDLCVFDPVQGFVPPEINMGSRNAMRNCMAQLVSLGEECGTSFLVICHSNKRKGASGRDRIADSSDLWDISRNVWMAGYTDREGIRYLSNEKNNYERLQDTILFSIGSDGQPHKEGTTWKRDRDYIQESGNGNTKATREECKETILSTLAENDMKMDVKDLDGLLQATGYSFHAIKTAKAELRSTGAVKLFNSGFGSEKRWTIERTEFSEPESYSLSDDE